ncbi:MAG: serine/threonine protein kinase [Nannocystaceae bacterium]|nr:serine/threonine protein kinase [Nannocystaceae bacterium]
MSTAEQAAAEPVRDRVADRLMLAAVAQRLLGRQAGATFKIDRFVVLHEIGAGGMGQVFVAYDPQLDRKIALKVVQPHASTHLDKARARLLSEAMALARLSHPNVVTIFEVGEVDREVFLAMEFVEGDDLSGWARKNPVPSPLREDHRMRTAHALLMQAGRGLAAAHAAGLIHRDFKPANVLVGVDARARVADFGLAREIRRQDRSSSPRLADPRRALRRALRRSRPRALCWAPRDTWRPSSDATAPLMRSPTNSHSVLLPGRCSSGLTLGLARPPTKSCRTHPMARQSDSSGRCFEG